MDHLDYVMTILRQEEGWCEHPYRCTKKKWTIGFGQLVPAPFDRVCDELEAAGADMTKCLRMSKQFGEVLFVAKVRAAEKFASGADWYRRLDTARKALILSMVYQMGWVGVCNFVNTIGALRAGDYESAALHMLDSTWAREETPTRARRHSAAMRSGSLRAWGLA